MAGAATLTEPTVLAHTKDRLFPEAADGYVVADTQFAQDRWVDDRRIDPAIRERLAPFNHVRVGSGYPDLVGVRALEDALLAVDRFGEAPPLVVVEAKGESARGVDVARGVVQAYDRLHEANVAFVAAPAGAITGGDRTLARQLNVGVLGVGDGGSVSVLERPRVVGNRTAEEATAIRFQASAQGVAGQSFGLNHPKNYLGAALAVAHGDGTRAVIDEYVVGAVGDALRGAVFLGLIEPAVDGHDLTSLGAEVVRFGLRTCGDLDAALARFEAWRGSRRRFVDLAPRWGDLARRVVFAYPATELLVAELQTMHDDGLAAPTLPAFVEWLHAHHPTFTVELFVRGEEDVRERALTGEGDLRGDVLTEGSTYHAPTVFQLKAMLYHAGVLTERGAEPSRLDPTADEWALREPLSRYR